MKFGITKFDSTHFESDGHVIDAVVERVGFLRWRGSICHIDNQGIEDGATAFGYTAKQVRRQLGMTDGWLIRMTTPPSALPRPPRPEVPTPLRSIRVGYDPALDWPEIYPDGGR